MNKTVNEWCTFRDWQDVKIKRLKEPDDEPADLWIVVWFLVAGLAVIAAIVNY